MAMMASTPPSPATAAALRMERTNLRFESERRQFAGLLMLTGFCAVIQPLANIVNSVDPEDGLVETDPVEVALWQFVGACCLFAIGAASILVGYLEFIHDWGTPPLYAVLIILTQTAFIPYISDMAAVGKTAVKDAPQFFVVFQDSSEGSRNANALEQQEVSFMGAMGIIGIAAYGFSFVGTIAFMQFALYAFQNGNPQHRNASYYQGRLKLYSFLLCLAGLCQLLLGSFATEFTTTNNNNGRIAGGFLRVAMFVVRVPSLSIAVGGLQFLNGFWAFVRSFGVFVGDKHDNAFQYSMGFQWVITLICQDIVQISLLPPGMLAPAAPTFAALSLGIHLMPALLDYKMRTTPEEIPEEYYFYPENEQEAAAAAEQQPMMKKRPPPTLPPNNRRPILYVVEKQAYVDPYDDYDDDEYYYDEQDFNPYTMPTTTTNEEQPPLQRQAYDDGTDVPQTPQEQSRQLEEPRQENARPNVEEHLNYKDPNRPSSKQEELMWV